LYRFDLTAKVQDSDITLGKTIYIASDDLEKAKKQAIRMFEDTMISRAQGSSTFEGKLWKLKRIVVTEYISKKKWKEIPENHYF
jgi:hypothetical protein